MLHSEKAFSYGLLSQNSQKALSEKRTEPFVQTSSSPFESFSLLAFAAVFSNSNLVDNPSRKLLIIISVKRQAAADFRKQGPLTGARQDPSSTQTNRLG